MLEGKIQVNSHSHISKTTRAKTFTVSTLMTSRKQLQTTLKQSRRTPRTQVKEKHRNTQLQRGNP